MKSSHSFCMANILSISIVFCLVISMFLHVSNFYEHIRKRSIKSIVTVLGSFQVTETIFEGFTPRKLGRTNIKPSLKHQSIFYECFLFTPL